MVLVGLSELPQFSPQGFGFGGFGHRLLDQVQELLCQHHTLFYVLACLWREVIQGVDPVHKPAQGVEQKNLLSSGQSDIPTQPGPRPPPELLALSAWLGLSTVGLIAGDGIQLGQVGADQWCRYSGEDEVVVA